MWSKSPRCQNGGGWTPWRAGKMMEDQEHGTDAQDWGSLEVSGKIAVVLPAFAHLEHEAASFSSSHISTDWTRSQGQPRSNTEQVITAEIFQAHSLLAQRHFLKILSALAVQISQLTLTTIHGAGDSTMKNLTQDHMVAKGKVWTWIWQTLKYDFGTNYHRACFQRDFQRVHQNWLGRPQVHSQRP